MYHVSLIAFLEREDHSVWLFRVRLNEATIRYVLNFVVSIPNLPQKQPGAYDEVLPERLISTRVGHNSGDRETFWSIVEPLHAASFTMESVGRSTPSKISTAPTTCRRVVATASRASSECVLAMAIGCLMAVMLSEEILGLSLEISKSL